MSVPMTPVRRGASRHGSMHPTPGLPAAFVVFVLAMVMALAPVLLTPLGAASAAPRPGAPEETGGVRLTLTEAGPTTLTEDSTLRVTVRVTNETSQTISDPQLTLRTRTSRVTDRAVLQEWQQQTEPDLGSAAIEDTGESPALPAGESVDMTLAVPAEDLGYDVEDYLWGARRISLTVSDGDEQLASLRTFTVWRPDGADASVTQSVLLPVAANRPGLAADDPEAYAESVTGGHLADVGALAVRDDVDWLLDPALLDPPRTPIEPEEDPAEEEDDGEGEDEAPDPVREYAATPQATEFATTLATASDGRTIIGLPYAQSDLFSLERAQVPQLREAVEGRARSVLNRADVEVSGTAAEVAGEQASPKTMRQAADTGADVLITPSYAVHADPLSTVTPSSVGLLQTSQDDTPLLAPDATLSHQFSLLHSGEDVGQVQQRLLAESATIASQQVTASRHVLIMPELPDDLDVEAASAALDAFEEAPWLSDGSTDDLLTAATDGSMGTETQAEDGSLYAFGEVTPDDVLPSAPDEDGALTHLDEAEERPLLDPEALRRLESSLAGLTALGDSMGESAQLDVPVERALSGTSRRWLGEPEQVSAHADGAAGELADLREAIKVVPASGYNLVSDSAGVPITVTNDLDTDITARVVMDVDKPLVRVGDPPLVKVPARGSTEVTVPVEAIANGSVTLQAVLDTDEGSRITEPVDVPLTVNPAWENWTTMALVVGMGVLIVVGVLRARRTGSSTRAPGVRGPEVDEPVDLRPSRGATGSEGDDQREDRGAGKDHGRGRAGDER